MEDAPLTVRCSGNAGQSFGVWNAGGLNLYLEGDANDYVGKGMAGGRIVLRHPNRARFVGKDTIIMGNTRLYGATGGGGGPPPPPRGRPPAGDSRARGRGEG